MIKNVDNIVQKTADISTVRKDNKQSEVKSDDFQSLLQTVFPKVKNAKVKKASDSKSQATDAEDGQTITLQALENVLSLLNIKSIAELKQYISEKPQEFLELAQKVQYSNINLKDLSLSGQTVNDNVVNELLKTLSLSNTADAANTEINFKTLQDKLQISSPEISKQVLSESITKVSDKTTKSKISETVDKSDNLINNEQVSNSENKIVENSQTFSDLTQEFSRSNYSKEDKESILSLVNMNSNKLNISEPKSETISQNVEYDRFATIKANEFAETTVNIVNNMKDNSNYTAKLFLKPESLGTVFVEIAMKDNKVNLKIHTDTQDALGSIETQISTLKEKLENNGIVTEKIELGMQSYDGNYSGKSNGQKNSQEENDIRKNYLDSFYDLNKEEDLSTNSFRTEQKEVQIAQADRQGSSMLERYI